MSRLVFVMCSLSMLALAATGCETHEASAAPTATPHQAASPASDDQALCVQLQTRARDCTDAYIPALVDARASLDKPAGIAADVQKDRDAVIAQAKQEWANDSTDAAIAAQCAGPFPGTAADRDTARTCMASADCDGYAACFVPIIKPYLK
jgi:hypothetical protein